jgi:hypothetical protein
VGPLRVVVFSPALDDDLSFSERVEDLPFRQFVRNGLVLAIHIRVEI